MRAGESARLVDPRQRAQGNRHHGDGQHGKYGSGNIELHRGVGVCQQHGKHGQDEEDAENRPCGRISATHITGNQRGDDAHHPAAHEHVADDLGCQRNGPADGHQKQRQGAVTEKYQAHAEQSQPSAPRYGGSHRIRPRCDHGG